MRIILALLAALALPVALAAQPPSLESGSVLEAAQRLRAGEYLWAPQVAPQGPVLLVISLATQRAVLYRNGLPIAITTVSTGRPGHRTPTGVFTVLQRRVEHYSSLYNNAPMPYMQRLTWGGVALHGGQLPGYPASHGCIRLPHEFARLLYGVTHQGMTVIVTNEAAVPRLAPGERLFEDSDASAAGATSWTPERAPSGPVSIVLSAADQRVIVLRNGRVVGRAPATIDGPLDRVSVYQLQSGEAGERRWLRVSLPGQSEAAESLRGRVHVADAFRARIEEVLAPGATAVLTPDSLQASGAERVIPLIEAAPR